MAIGEWVALAIVVLLGVTFVFIPLSTLIDKHRVRNGKGHIYKGKLREIVVVKKRVTERELFHTGLNLNHTGPINKSSYKTMRNVSVDYRVVGRNMLHTKYISEDVLRRLQVGKTYKALIRYNSIEKIYHQ